MTILKPGYLRWDGSKYLTDSNINISLGGDVSGSNTGVTVVGIQGRSISSAAPGDGFVLAWSSSANSWQPISLTADLGPAGGDLSGTYPSPTVAKIQGNAVKSGALTSVNDGYVLTWVNSSNNWQALAPSGGVSLLGDVNGPATANYVSTLTGTGSLVTIANGTNLKTAGTSLAFKDSTSTTRASLSMTHGLITAGGGGTDFQAVIGPVVGAETTNAGLYLIANGATPGSNYSVRSDGVNVFINAPTGGGYITFYSGAATLLSTWTPSVLGLNSLAQIQWAAGIVSPNIAQAQQANASAPQNMTIAPQAPGAGATNPTNGTAGSLVVNLAAPTNGTTEAAFVVERAGTTKLMSVQQYPGLAGTVSLVLNNGASTAYTLYNDASNNTHISTVSGGAIYFENAGSQLSYQSGAGTGIWHLTAIRTFEWDAVVSIPTIQQVAPGGNVLPQPLKISAQGPYSLATGANQNPGDLILEIPKSISANAFYGGVLIRQADPTTPTPMIRMGMYGGPTTTYAGIWFTDAGAPGGGNFSFLGNQSQTYLNNPSSVTITIAGTAGNGFTLTGGATQQVLCGTAVTSAQWGTNLANAVWNLAGGTQVTVLSLKAPGAVAGTGNLSVIGSIQNTYRTSAVSFTVDTTTTDTIIHLTATQSVTLPVPTAGRVLEFWIDLIGGADATITFIRNGGIGNINGVAASLVVGPYTAGSMSRLLGRSDGTNWFIAG